MNKREKEPEDRAAAIDELLKIKWTHYIVMYSTQDADK